MRKAALYALGFLAIQVVSAVADEPIIVPRNDARVEVAGTHRIVEGRPLACGVQVKIIQDFALSAIPFRVWLFATLRLTPEGVARQKLQLESTIVTELAGHTAISAPRRLDFVANGKTTAEWHTTLAIDRKTMLREANVYEAATLTPLDLRTGALVVYSLADGSGPFTVSVQADQTDDATRSFAQCADAQLPMR